MEYFALLPIPHCPVAKLSRSAGTERSDATLPFAAEVMYGRFYEEAPILESGRPAEETLPRLHSLPPSARLLGQEDPGQDALLPATGAASQRQTGGHPRRRVGRGTCTPQGPGRRAACWTDAAGEVRRSDGHGRVQSLPDRQT